MPKKELTNITANLCLKNRKYIFSKNFRESSKVELVCLVHAQPHATIHWFKNSVQLTEDNVTLENIGHKNTLTIPSLSHSDYGNYTCRAKNIHGESSKVLEVSGMFLWNLKFRSCLKTIPKDLRELPGLYLVLFLTSSFLDDKFFS